jgi:hypothetical protein
MGLKPQAVKAHPWLYLWPPEGMRSAPTAVDFPPGGITLVAQTCITLRPGAASASSEHLYLSTLNSVSF